MLGLSWSLLSLACGDGEDGSSGALSAGGAGGSSGGAGGKKTGPKEPFAYDACGNGLDDDGDGAIDEDCSCKPGTQQLCFPGSSSKKGVGLCKPGKQSCLDYQELGAVWGPCEGAVSPALFEACDGSLKDATCDGQQELGCECKPGQQRPCGSDVGQCERGKQLCSLSGRWGLCKGSKPPQAETCGDGIDNNCDGKTDEGCSPCDDGDVQPCTVPLGQCGFWEQSCVKGLWGGCHKAASLPLERCGNGVDDDCDGQTDEGCPCQPGQQQMCMGPGVGKCKYGAQICGASGAWGECAPADAKEECNGVDDDCDGRVDDLTKPCSTGCGESESKCVDGEWGPCQPKNPPPEVCDGKDNDCDGQVDEGIVCECLAGEEVVCGQTLGQCKAGKQVCGATNEWGPCEGGVGPTAEVCDGADNDCNGLVDDVAPACQCLVGQKQGCPGSNVGACKSGEQTCDGAGQWGACQGVVLASPELCDGVDNDCDGQVDEELTQPCDGGCGASGTQTCSGGSWSACNIPSLQVLLAGLTDCPNSLVCPPCAPYVIGCQFDFAGDKKNCCVAYDPANPSQVRVKEGNNCDPAGSNSGATGSITCSSSPGQGINESTCPVGGNGKTQKNYVVSSSENDCPPEM